MARSLQIDVLKRNRGSTVLGMTLDGSRIEGAVVRRTNGSVQVVQSFTANLSLNPLTAGPELVGREIRNCLDKAGVRARTCVLGLPINWLLTAHTEIPEMAEADAANLVTLETERVFPCDPASLQIVSIRGPVIAGKSSVLLTGIPKANVELLANALRAAKLHPVSFSLALTALQPVGEARTAGVIALSIGESTLGLQVTGKDSLISLRALEGVIQQEGGQRELNTAAIARETRITLGQLPPAQREAIQHVRIYGPEDLAQHLADEIELRSEAIGLEPEIVRNFGPTEHGLKVPAGTPVSGAASLAILHLSEKKTPFQFLPPRVTPLQRWSRRYASGRLRVAAGIAALLLLIAGVLFGYQQWRLVRLESQWDSMSAQVKDLQNAQERIRRFRPWYDESFSSLAVLRQLTTAFPTEGTVNAKTVEIRNSENVTCTGTARDNRSLLATLDRLRAGQGVSDVKVSQLRGRSPTQFTFEFRWKGQVAQ